MLRAGDALSDQVAKTSVDARPSEALQSAATHAATHAAVHEGEHFRGLVDLRSTLSSSPERIFADLLPDGERVSLPPEAPVKDVGRLLRESNVDAIAIVDDQGGFIGAVTQASLLEALLADKTESLAESNRLRAAIEAGHGRLRAILETAVDGVITIDPRGRIEFFNPAAERIFGYSAGDMIGRNVSVLMTPDDAEHHDGYLRNYLRTGQAKIIGRGREVVGHRQDGTTFPLDLAIADARVGEEVRFTAFVRDISDRKRAEEALVQSEKRLGLTLDAVGGGVFDWRIPSEEWIRSDSWYELTGFDRQELAAWEAEHGSIIHPDDYDGMVEAFERHARREADRYHHEFRIRHKSGEWRWLLGRGLIVERGPDGAPLRMVGTDTDITERKRAEEALRESRALLKAVIEGTTNAIAVTDLDGRFMLVNPTAADWLGRPAEELVGRLESEFHPPKVAARIVEDDRRVLAGENTGEFENTIISDGTSITYLAAKSVLRDERGEAVGLIGVARDITRRKQAEEALRKSRDELEQRVAERTAELTAVNERLRSEMAERERAEEALRESELWMRNIFNSLEESVLVVTADRRIVNVNAAAEATFGYSRDEMVNRSTDFLHVDREHYLEFGRRIQAAFDRGEAANIEFQAKRKNGAVFPTEHTVSLLKNDAGEAVGIVSVIRDVSERKRAEDARRENEQRYRALFEQSPDAIVILDPDTTLPIEFNDLAPQMLGYSREEFAKLPVSAYEATETWQEVCAHAQKVQREGRDEFETTMRTKRGRLLNVLVNVRVVEIGGRRLFHSVRRDITERKQAEEHERRHQAELAHVARLSTMGEMATGLAHELNQPLAAIMNYCEVCRRRIPAGRREFDDPREDLEQIALQAERAGAVIRRVRSFVRKREPGRSSVNLNAAIRAVTDLLAADARAN